MSANSRVTQQEATIAEISENLKISKKAEILKNRFGIIDLINSIFLGYKRFKFKELKMSLLKNLLIIGLFVSVYVAVSPAFANTDLNKNEYEITGGTVLGYKTTSKYKNADNCVSACVKKSNCEAYSLNTKGAYCVLYSSVRSIQPKEGAFTAQRKEFN